MSKEEKLQLENALSLTCSKAQAINKYIDELEESSKLSELWCDSRTKIRELENQQKEFIEYLEKIIVDSKAGSGQQYYAQEHLKMFKEIIGENK